MSDTVAAPIEQSVNGVENMLYMSSTCSSDGSYQLTATFEIGTNLDQAQVLLQNRVAIAEPLLPEEVRRQGVTVKKQSSNIMLVISFTGDDDKGKNMDGVFLSNFANLRVRDRLSRVKGVGDVVTFGGSNYSMRVWLDPEKIKSRNMTTQDVIAAIAEQNVQVAAGQVGQAPYEAMGRTSSTLLRLSVDSAIPSSSARSSSKPRMAGASPISKTSPTIELGAQTYDQFSLKGGRPSGEPWHFPAPWLQRTGRGRRSRSTRWRNSSRRSPRVSNLTIRSTRPSSSKPRFTKFIRRSSKRACSCSS